MKSSRIALILCMLSAAIDLMATVSGHPGARGQMGSDIFLAAWLICRAIEEK